MKNRILIVEDEEAIAKMISMNLKVSNYDTKIYSDGLEAAEALKEDSEYDLALLDVMLPGMDGFELLEIVKQYRIPVIFLTAKDDIESKIQGLRGGADDYIVKPFEVLELLVRIEKVLERENKLSDVIKVLDLEIDISQRTVRKNGVEILLKPKEFELLRVLAKNKNIAISREKLLSMVWGYEYMGETRTVDTHVQQVRKKMKLKEKLVTIPKVGYCLYS